MLIALLLPLAFLAPAQDGGLTAEQLLDRMIEAARAADRFDYEVEVHATGTYGMFFPRSEGRVGFERRDPPGPFGGRIVLHATTDGTPLTLDLEPARSRLLRGGVLETTSDPEDVPMMLALLQATGFLLVPELHAPDQLEALRVLGPRIVGEDVVGDVETWRLEVGDESATMTLSVGKDDARVRRLEMTAMGDDDTRVVRELTALRVGEAAQDEAFAFDVPATAQHRTFEVPPELAARMGRVTGGEVGDGGDDEASAAQAAAPAPGSGDAREPDGLVPAAEREAFPAFTLTSVDGEVVSLESLRGKVVVLDFWATWCKPCIRAMPGLQEIHEDFARSGAVAVLGMNVLERGDPAALLAEKGFTYPTLLEADAVASRMGYRAIPQIVLLDQEGRIAHQRTGFSPDHDHQLRGMIATLLGADS